MHPLFRRVVLSALTLGLAVSSQTQVAPAPNMVGFWWKPSESGWGLSIQQQGDRAFAIWYTYNEQSKPIWYTLDCAISGTTCSGDLFTGTGKPFAQLSDGSPNSTAATKAGSGSLTMSNPGSTSNRLTLRYTIGNVTQAKTDLEPFNLVAAQNVPVCTLQSGSRANATNYTDLWWGGAAGSGWGMQISHQANQVFLGWYAYDDQNQASWFTGQATQDANNPKRFTGTLFKVPTGIPFNQINGPIAANAAISAGSIELNFTNGEQGTISYALSAAGAATRTLTMQRFAIGSGSTNLCAAPASQSSESAIRAEIEKSQGAVLEKPVFMCGSGTDTVTGDTAPNSVTVFEGGPVRPLALSADGKRLFIANAPANCLEIYNVEGDTLRLASTIAVGVEPIAVAERNDREVWVVNHVSDSVSVVRMDGAPRVLRTLQVGDEPRDIVFAGPNRDRAFITAAFRGQNRPGATSSPPTTAGAGRADVWVFDAANLDDSLNGKPLSILTLFADTPRALSVSNDGGTVYAAAFMSGNRTTVLNREVVLGKKPTPSKSVEGVTAPDTALIVKFDGTAWRDEAGTDWSTSVKFSLPDYDVFAIDANAATPTVLTQFSGVGTTLFNMAVHPASGALYVSNTESVNHIRFEGPGKNASTVRGRIAESRLSVVDVNTGRVEPVHLNSHVSFTLPQGQAIPAEEKAKSLAQPTALVFSPNGDTLYTAAFGSGKVAALPTRSIASSQFVPNASQHINVPQGPAGLAVNASGSRLYVYSRIANRVSVVDTSSKAVVNGVSLFSPESARVTAGRRFLYDANFTSGNGTTSCASCHVFADMDHLAWDLGDPDGTMKANPNPYVRLSPRTTLQFHPMKGPMTTQTLRGMANHGPMHWRGDRTGTNRQTVNGKLESIEEAAFKEFNPAFVGLVGRESPLSAEDMQLFTDFAMALMPPPNPIRALDNSLNAEQQAGREIYFNNTTTTLLGGCNTCHTIDPANKRFGTSGLMTFEGLRAPENLKVPHIRNAYQKLGMFGFSNSTAAPTGPQVRGFGFSSDGSIDTLQQFFSDGVFNFPAPVTTTRTQVSAFVLAADSNMKPIVGQQVTWRPNAPNDVASRLTLLEQQAQAAACDLTVRGGGSDAPLSGLLQTDGTWLLRGGGTLSAQALRERATPSQPLTFSCLPPGNGRRAALDRP